MTVCAVVTRNYREAVVSAVSKTGNILLDICVEGDDRRDSASAINLQMAAKPDLMIIDLSVTLDFPWNAIYRIRLAAPDARVIIIGEDEQSPLYTQLVQAGIYDIITVGEIRFLSSLVEAAINHPANYASATRFVSVPDDDGNKRAPRLTQQARIVNEVNVIEERTIGCVSIAVASVLPRTGCTSVSISIAHYLADKGLRVAIWIPNSEHFRALQDSYNDVEVAENGTRFTLDKIVFFCGSDISEISNYSYIVLDIGVLTPEMIKEFKRSTVKLLLSGTMVWELPILEIFLKTNMAQKEPLDTYLYGFVHSDKDSFDKLVKSMDNLKCVFVPGIIDPFVTNPDIDEMMDFMLGSYLPGTRPQKPKGRAVRGLLSLFGKRNNARQASNKEEACNEGLNYDVNS